MSKTKSTQTKPKSNTQNKKVKSKQTTSKAIKSKSKTKAVKTKSPSKSKTVASKSTSKPNGIKPVSTQKTITIPVNYLIALVGIIVGLGLAGAFFAQRQLTAATINGESISRLSLIQQMEAQYGGELLDGLITETLIDQEIARSNVVISDEAAQAALTEFEGQVVSQGQDLDSLLAFQGQTREELLEQFRMNLAIEELIGEPEEVTEEEIDTFLETNADFVPEELTAEERANFAGEQLAQQARQQLFQFWMDDLRATAEINRLPAYQSANPF